MSQIPAAALSSSDSLPQIDIAMPPVEPDEWEIPAEELELGPRIGIGSFGEVHRGTWRHTDVAIKKFLEQDFSPQLMQVCTERPNSAFDSTCVDNRAYIGSYNSGSAGLFFSMFCMSFHRRVGVSCMAKGSSLSDPALALPAVLMCNLQKQQVWLLHTMARFIVCYDLVQHTSGGWTFACTPVLQHQLPLCGI